MRATCFLTALGTALGHYCQPSASRRADNNDRGLFRGLSKNHVALSNHVIVILSFNIEAKRDFGHAGTVSYRAANEIQRAANTFAARYK